VDVTASTVNELTADAGGRWLVVTETACYTVDLDGQTIVRYPGAGTGPISADYPVTVADLRRDEQSIPLIQLVRCRVGGSMLLMLNIRQDGILTARMTTVVRSISCLPPVAPDLPQAVD
jgi:hypothetical protein